MTFTMTVTPVPDTINELNPDEMSTIAGGTFTKNAFSKDTYHSVGISTSYHFFDCDEFMIMGRSISYDLANEIVRLANRVYGALNDGQHGANCISFSEPAFIRSFNSQLSLIYGFKWDGIPGHDY